MKKLTQQTPDLTKENIGKIADLFPQVVTEKEGDDGVPTRSVDFDLLRQLLSDSLVEGADERYRLDWPGKRASLLKANTPIAKTLRPDRASSVDFDTTQNVFIEGDNFEALKVLQESYLGKVKMIYIDPPYNTGKDFVYSDNFTQDKAEYEEEIEAVDEEGNKMFRENTRTNPRFHSDWLSMMYERLIIARDLLRDDGVIFISIDDNEVHNLRKVCDEIFGESNVLGLISVVNNLKGRSDDEHIATANEFLLVCAKNYELFEMNGFALSSENVAEYDLEDEYGKYKEIGFRKTGKGWKREDRPNMYYPIWVNPHTSDFSLEKKEQYIEILPLTSKGEQGRWRWGKDTFIRDSKKDISIRKVRGGKFSVFTKMRLNISDDEERTLLPKSIWLDAKYDSGKGSKEVKELFGTTNEYFENPKPLNFLKDVIRVSSGDDDIVLDFFSGSATTAHAIMDLNTEDGGNRKFILVQLAEETPGDSEASKAGYKTIAELGRERIRRAAAKIKTDYADKLAEREAPLDTGFRAYTVADTAFLDVERHPSELEQGQLLELANNIKNDRTPEDLLTQVMLELGLTLDLPIETKQIGANTVFYVAGNALVACFDESVPTTLIDEMAKCQPLQIAFKDASFGSDDALINAETHLKRLSPETTLSII